MMQIWNIFPMMRFRLANVKYSRVHFSNTSRLHAEIHMFSSYIVGFVQDCNNSSALGMRLLQSCA